MINITKIVKEIEIDLTTSNDCELVLDVLKNTKIISELYSSYYDGADHITCVLYADADNYEELISKFPVFENIGYVEYELDYECDEDLFNIKKSIIDDVYELKDIYTRYEKLVERYSIEPKD